ncbi:protein YLS7 [Dendrobium catenatum]|uniref:protein YLS7 n=1 Tax=Dendrobium catenatum TaxID=906689 RepID=UPI0009F29F40|nr:protein YLS7 [Dendrobium catenatum]
MVFSCTNSKSFSMAALRSLPSIIAIVGASAIFLIVASLLLVSGPITSSVQEYFLGENRGWKPESPASLNIVSQGKPQLEGNESGSVDVGTSGAVLDLRKFDDDLSFTLGANQSSSNTPFAKEFGGNSNDPDADLVTSKSPVFPSGEHVRCDLYHGKWVHNPEGPLYTNNSCPIITQLQNCQGNGRPDKDYENWRWKPDQCELPKFDAKKFLELMRGKTLAFVGDSVARNQMESLLCILWQVEVPKNRGNRRIHRWYFRSTSTMIVRIWSSWLAQNTPSAMEFAPKGVVKVHLDIPDEKMMEFLPGFDVVVLSSGHWFAKQSVYILNETIVGGQLWSPPPNAAVDMRINNVEAFGLSMETALGAIATHPNFTGLAIVRSYSPDHYEGGAWNTGGSCTGKVNPVSEVVNNGFTEVMHEKQLTGFQRAVEKTGNSSKLIFMDITDVFGYRPDGHPGPYRSTDPNKKTRRGPNGEPPPQDCLHWCMPGPIDTWNELLLEIIRRNLKIS